MEGLIFRRLALALTVVSSLSCTRSAPKAQDIPPPKAETTPTPSYGSGDQGKGQPNNSANPNVTITPSSTDGGVAMSFQKEDFAKYAIDADQLFYEASFVDSKGTELASIDRTKLDFDAATETAKVVLKVKIGSTGKVQLKVEDASDGTRFEGTSDEITVTEKTNVSMTLKKVSGDGGDDDQKNDGEVTIDITADDLKDLTQDGSSDTSDNTRGDDSDNQDNSDDTADNDDDGDDTRGDDNGDQGDSKVSYKPFSGELTSSQLNQWMDAHKAKKGADARYFGYTYVPADMASDKEKANIARVAVFKALNNTAINMTEIYTGEDASDGHGLLFAFDIRKIWGPDAEAASRKWRVVAEGRGKTIFASAPSQRLAAFDRNAPVSADRLIYNVQHGKIYNVLIDTPEYENILRRNIKVKDEVLAWAAQKNAIVFGPRITWLRETEDGRKYWATGDEFSGREGKEIPYASGDPIPRLRGGSRGGMLTLKTGGAVASEAWIEMKNGLIAYYIWGNAAQERTRAEQSFVVDPRMPDRYLITGRSCITCHVGGVQAAPSDMWRYIEEGRITGQNAERAREFWTSNEKLAKLYGESRVIFVGAMKEIVGSLSDGDKDFNRALAEGATEEPTYTLVKRIDEGRSGRTGSGRSGGGRSGGGFGSFGLTPGVHH